MRTRLLIVAVSIPLALLSACGGDEGDATDPGAADPATQSASDGPSGSPSDPVTSQTPPVATEDPSADWASCATVWVDGARLPRAYPGCREGETAVKADGRACSFGRSLIVYADRFYAVPTGVIHRTSGPLAKDRGYRSALASCTA